MNDDLITRLRNGAADPMWAHHVEAPKSLLSKAADTLEAAHAVGIRQEQAIMDQEREIERLRAAAQQSRDALRRMLIGCEWKSLSGLWAWHNKQMPSDDALSVARESLRALDEALEQK